MRIDLFRMERTQCLYENEVEFNLSESGVLPLRVEEVLQSSKESADFLALGLKYPESDGSEQLRECIALWYGTTSRPCAGHERRVRGELHRPVGTAGER